MSPSTTRQTPPVRELQTIPGVGPSIARDLHDLGYRSVAALRHEDPEAMYERLCLLRGTQIDRCVLYVFRCAVYFATEPDPDPTRLAWWRWKEVPAQGRRGH